MVQGQILRLQARWAHRKDPSGDTIGTAQRVRFAQVGWHVKAGLVIGGMGVFVLLVGVAAG
jgi:hypothetical protein